MNNAHNLHEPLTPLAPTPLTCDEVQHFRQVLTHDAQRLRAADNENLALLCDDALDTLLKSEFKDKDHQPTQRLRDARTEILRFFQAQPEIVLTGREQDFLQDLLTNDQSDDPVDYEPASDSCPECGQTYLDRTPIYDDEWITQLNQILQNHRNDHYTPQFISV